MAVLKDSAYADDLHQLTGLAIFCNEVAKSFVKTIGRDQESQSQLVKFLVPSITAAEYKISKAFLAEEVKLTDAKLFNNWDSAPVQMAWLMVHPQMSEYFARYAQHRWSSQIYLIHHIPKTAGTAVYDLLKSQDYFVAFPQPSFKAMASMHGLLGFGKRLSQFKHRYKQDRLYIAGHYNLPDTVRRNQLFGRCQGVTLCRPPFEILSSAIRYVWTRVEAGETELIRHYGLEWVNRDEMPALRESLDATDIMDKKMVEIIEAIRNSAKFRFDFDEIYVKYFYNEQVANPAQLREFLQQCGSLFPSLHPGNDEQMTLRALKVDGTLPRSNVSSLSDRHLVRALGGPDAFRQMALERMRESLKIYAALQEFRADSARPS